MAKHGHKWWKLGGGACGATALFSLLERWFIFLKLQNCGKRSVFDMWHIHFRFQNCQKLLEARLKMNFPWFSLQRNYDFWKNECQKLVRMWQPELFFICRPEEITSSSRFCGWPTSWACQVLSRDQDHIQLCNVSSRTPRHIIEVQLQLVSWQLAGRELPQRNIKSVWKNARELPQRRIKSVIKITGNFHSVTSGRCLKLQENFHSVASEACLKLQENFHSVASRRYSPQPPKTLPP